MSDSDKMNENSAEQDAKVFTKSETEETDESPNQSANMVLNEDCNDLNAENNNEGVLVGNIDVIEPEFNEFETEQTNNSETIHVSKQNNNNINLCYANDCDNLDNDSLQVDVPHDETGLYDDVMACPNISNSEFNSDLTGPCSNESMSDNKSQSGHHANSFKHESNNNIGKSQGGYIKRVSCYVGNLTWWTTDQDLNDIVASLGITDLIEIKFYENKINGQSKGFAMVTCGSDQSYRTIMDKLPKKEIHSQIPVVTPFSRHYFNQFEEQARRDMPSTNNGGGGSNSDSGHNSNHYMSRNDNQHASSHHHHSSLNINSMHNQSGGQYQTNQMNRNSNNNGNRYPSNNGNSNMPAGILGQGPRANMLPNNQSNIMMQRPGIVGNYQPRHNSMNASMNQQSIMGMNNPNIPNSNQIRPAYNNNNNGFNSNQRNLNPNHQSSLMGSRPPLIQSNANGSGLLPIRPGINPALVGNNGPMGQGPGLLNNPRIPIGNQSMSGMHRQNWEQSQSSNSIPINNQFNNNMPNHQNNNPMMQINQNPMNNRLGPALSQNPQQNGILPNPPHPLAFQNQQGMPNQPNFQHPHSNQQVNFNTPLNQQQSLMNPQATHMMNNNLTGPMGNVMPLPQSHLGQMNPSGVNQMPPQQHHDLYFRQADSAHNPTSPGMNHMGQHMQMNQQQHKMSDMEFQEAFEKNRIVSSSAITRAVQDASIGQFPSAIETLITAISLIKQSKISNDERCKLFIMSLQDTKKGIEDKYYNGGRSMSGGMEVINSGHGRGESRDRERLKRSRSRDSRDRRDRGEGREDRERDRERDRSERGDRERGSRRSEKHHRSHRERSSRERSRDRRIVSTSDFDAIAQGDYYDDSLSNQSSRYHRRRH